MVSCRSCLLRYRELDVGAKQVVRYSRRIDQSKRDRRKMVVGFHACTVSMRSTYGRGVFAISISLYAMCVRFVMRAYFECYPLVLVGVSWFH